MDRLGGDRGRAGRLALVAPFPFRTPAQAVDDLFVWSQGMVFTYNTYGIAQRPFRSYSYKNQSIMALRTSSASRRAGRWRVGPFEESACRPRPARPAKGLPPLDPSTDLLTFLKPHHASPRPAQSGRHGHGCGKHEPSGAHRRWDDVLQGAEPALRAAWRVNFVDLDFRAVTAITVAAILSLCLFVAAVLPRADRRTRQTDALEFALVTLLTVMFSPLSFNYAYVWLIYSDDGGLASSLERRPRPHPGTAKVAWIAAVLAIPALAIPFREAAQAYGNLFVPALLLLLGFGLKLHSTNGASTPWPRAHKPRIPDPCLTAGEHR